MSRSRTDKASSKKEGSAANSTGATVGYEADLSRTADALRGGRDAAEYKHVDLGLLFLKSISDAFNAQHGKGEDERNQCADPRGSRLSRSPCLRVPVSCDSTI